MLETRTVAVSTFLLGATVLIATTAAWRMVSSTASLATTEPPCDGSKAKKEGKGVQSVKCSSTDECFRLGQQYLNKPSGAAMAQEALQRAVALDPSNAAAHRELASAYMRPYEETNLGHMSQEEYCWAETACRAAISLVPDDAEALLLLGQILNGELYYGFRSDDAAIEALKKAIELKPTWADLYCELAHAYNLLNRYEEAAAAYSVEATLRRENETPQQHSNLALLESQKHHEVRDAFVVAQIYTKLGQYDKALTFLQHAASISPGDDNIHYWIGKTFLSLGDIQSAKRQQELLADLCRSKDKFFVTQCEVSAKSLLDALQQTSR